MHLEIVKEIFDLIEEFKNSEFYTVIYSERVRTLKSRTHPFLISVRVDPDGACAVLTSTSKQNKICVTFSPRFLIQLCSEISLRAPCDLPPVYKDKEPLCNFTWKVEASFAGSFFGEALEVVKAARDLEKQGKYFVEPWEPSFLQSDTILFSQTGHTLTALPRKEVEKIYEEQMRNLFREHLRTLDSASFYRIAKQFENMELPVFKKSIRVYPSARVMKKKIKILIDSALEEI